MGKQYIEGFLDMGVEQYTALKIHLSTNHFPSVSHVFIPVAEEAIVEANVGNWTHMILMPNGITKSVSDIVSELHLDSFLEPSEGSEEFDLFDEGDSWEDG